MNLNCMNLNCGNLDGVHLERGVNRSGRLF
jgi:hypothetical protein